jgi:hypothetical protein
VHVLLSNTSPDAQQHRRNSTTVVDENHLTVNLTIPANAPTG